MSKYCFLILALLLYSNFLLAQSHLAPCDLQVKITTSICFDPPGCAIFTANPTGGQEPYSYAWENGVMNQRNEYWNPSNPYQGTCEIVTVTDANGCKAIVGTVFDFQTTPNFGLTPDTLFVEEEAITFDVSSNDTLQGVTYELVQSSTYGDLVFDNVGQGTYTPDASYCGPDYFRYLVHTDSCDYSEIVTVCAFNGPCADVLLTRSDCNNLCTGSAIFYNQGIFTPPLTYNWSNGTSDESATGLCMGNGSLTVTDVEGTSEVYQFVIEGSALDVTIDAVDVTCQYSNILLSPSYSQSITEDLYFTWSGPKVFPFLENNITQNISPSHADSTYVFELISYASNGCVDTAFHSVKIIESPSIRSIVDNEKFCPLDHLELSAIIENGTPPYSYQWLGPQGIYSDEPVFRFLNAASAQAGSYKLHLLDSNGCSASRTKSITGQDSTDVQIRASGSDDVLCQGSDLELRFGVTSGSWTAPYKVEWTGPNGYYSTELYPLVENIQSDMAGFYSVNVFYSENCFLTDSTEVIVSNESAEVIDLQITPPTKCWSDDGQVQVLMSTLPPYSVFSSRDNRTYNFDDNPFVFSWADDGKNRLEISSGNCIVYLPIDVPKPDIPSIITTDPTCLGNDGTAEVFSPNAPQVSARFYPQYPIGSDRIDGLFVENLIATTYEVSIRDSVTNCTHEELITINPYLDFEINVINKPSCDMANGSIEVVSTGQAIPPISYTWSNNISGSLNSGLEAGSYSVTMTDGDGCQRHENIFLPTDQFCNSLISGHVFFNFDCECIVDGDEIPLANIRVCAESGTYTDCFYTDVNGAFWLLPIFEGDYTLTAYPVNEFIEGSCAPQEITISSDPLIINNADFFFCGDIITDLSIAANCSVARPGFIQDHNFHVSHEGTSFTDTLVDLSVNLDDNLEVFQITPAPNFQNLITNEFSWNNYPIEFNSKEVFKIRSTVNSMLGDTLITTAQITANNDDLNLDNNYTFCEQIVVGSYDPNDKLVNPLGSGDNGQITVADSIFNYTIRFQNTGTDTAFTVVVRDTLDRNIFELNSVQPSMSSHRYQLDVEGDNILVFTFDNIYLPDSTRNEAGSHGFVTFDIALKSDLPLSTYVQNTAAIYFDFNEPIITNTTSNFITVQKEIFQNSASLKVYPSPLQDNGFVKISLKQPVEYAVLEFLTIDGGLVQTILAPTSISEGELVVPFNVSSIPTGVYLFNLRTNRGNAVVKVVKTNE